MEKITVGCLEECCLPDLSVDNLLVRIDTGAKTSALHVDNVQRFTKQNKPYVRFELHPNVYNIDELVQCELPLIDIRRIKSSNGDVDERYIVQTQFMLAGQQWPIEVSLSNREDMNYLMLLGRQGMSGRVLVDPSETFIASTQSSET